MTPKQTRALAALLTCPTKEQAAAAAGIGLTTLKRYLADQSFQEEYKRAVSGLIEEAAITAKQSLDPALSCLREIVEDGEAADTARIQAARSLLEFGMRMVELTDITQRIDRLEKIAGGEIRG